MKPQLQPGKKYPVDYLPAFEALNLIPELKMNRWTATKLGILGSMDLIYSYKSLTERKTMLYLPHIVEMLEILKYRKTAFSLNQINGNDFLTPAETYELIPELKHHFWTATKIGVLHSLGLVHGYRSSAERKTLIYVFHVRELLEIKKNRIGGYCGLI